MAEPVVRAAGLHVHIGRNSVLCGLDVTVHRGEVLAVVGPNGSGKSTFVKALVGLYRPSSGSVTLTSPGTGGRLERSRIGYVPQRVSIDGSLPASVLEVVASGVHHGFLGRTTRPTKEAVLAALALVDLAELHHRPVTELSGGQQQRVLIARALIRNPELLVLDEPMAGVDLAQQEQFAKILSRLRDDDRTIVIVLHEFGQLAPVISRVIGLKAGALDFIASPQHASATCEDDASALPSGWTRAAPHDHVHPHEDAANRVGSWVPVQAPLDTARKR